VLTSAVDEAHCLANDEPPMPFYSGSREDWLRRASAFSSSRSGIALLALIAFADSSILPILPDLLLVPMLLLRPDRRFDFAGARGHWRQSQRRDDGSDPFSCIHGTHATSSND
jgi:hypothetical protein